MPEFGTMPMSGAIVAAHYRELDAKDVGADDLEAGHEAFDDIFGPAESFQIDEVVDPNDTRDRIICVLTAVRASARGVEYKHGIMP